MSEFFGVFRFEFLYELPSASSIFGFAFKGINSVRVSKTDALYIFPKDIHEISGDGDKRQIGKKSLYPSIPY